MRAISWNCRGLGNPQSVRALREMVQCWDPNIVFLMETKLKLSAMKRAKEKGGFVFGLIVPKAKNCRGLAMLWKKEIKLEIMGYYGNFIDAIVTDEHSGCKWRITGFYGHPETHRRKESWEQLKGLNRKFQLPWLCLGDFNEILSMSEKWGGGLRPQKQIEDFKSAVDVYSFKDLGYIGPKFTWCNMQEGEDRIYVRLDRALAMQTWIGIHEEARVHHIVDSTSDHLALFVLDSFVPNHPRKHRFHFEDMWVKKK